MLETFNSMLTQLPEDILTRPPQETLQDDASPSTPAPPVRLPPISVGDTPDLSGSDLQVQAVLGMGGMGVVHRAAQPMLNRDVAIKRVRPGSAPVATHALLREARIVGRLEHPNIVPVHALGVDPHTNQPLLVMKYVRGVPWSALMNDPEHPHWASRGGLAQGALARNVEVLIEVCRAVHFAHTHGVLHRDIKPPNVMVGAHGEVHLLDWGAAIELVDEAARRRLMGTPAYMAPESMNRGRPVDERADVFMLGACLYQVLTGRPPHSGDSMEATLHSVFEWQGPTFDEARPGSLAAICVRALARGPEDRFPTAAALQAALAEWLRNQGALALIAAARDKLEVVQAELAAGGGDNPAVGARLDEARFAWHAALLGWPESAEAKHGLREVLELSFDLQLEQGNAASAAVLLSELEALGADSRARKTQLVGLERRIALERQLAADFDVEMHAGRRRNLLLAMSLAGFLVAGGLLGGLLADPRDLTAASLVRVGLVFNAVLILITWLGRSWLRSNRVNRGYAAAIVGTGIAVELSRVLAWRVGVEPTVVLTLESLLAAVASTVLTPFVGRMMGAYAAMWYGLAAVAILDPSLAFPQQILGYSITGAIAVFVAVARRRPALGP